MNRQRNRDTDRQTDREIVWLPTASIDGYSMKSTAQRHTDRHRDRQTKRQTDRDTDKQRHSMLTDALHEWIFDEIDGVDVQVRQGLSGAVQRQTESQTHRQTDREIEREIDRHIDRQRDRHILTDILHGRIFDEIDGVDVQSRECLSGAVQRQTERHTHRQTDRKRDRKRDRQTHLPTFFMDGYSMKSTASTSKLEKVEAARSKGTAFGYLKH